MNFSLYKFIIHFWSFKFWTVSQISCHFCSDNFYFVTQSLFIWVWSWYAFRLCIITYNSYLEIWLSYCNNWLMLWYEMSECPLWCFISEILSWSEEFLITSQIWILVCTQLRLTLTVWINWEAWVDWQLRERAEKQ